VIKVKSVSHIQAG